MKLKNILIVCGLYAVGLSSCSYLDIVPDEVVTSKDTYQNEEMARNYLYSCYGAIPRRSDTDNRIEWRGGGMEFLVWEPLFHNVYYSPSSVSRQTRQMWEGLLDGIRLCYQFVDVVDKTPGITPENLKYYKAEAQFLIPYYHFAMLEHFGPTPIIKGAFDLNIPVKDLPERNSYDECVEWIDQKLVDVLPDLADSWSGTDYGRITKAAVWAIRSRMHLYAASPLFNGNPMYADFKSPIDGRNLISQEFDVAKWEKAAKVTKEAIDAVNSLGYHLYGDVEAGVPDLQKPGFSDPAQRRVKYSFMDVDNPCEILLAETRADDIYDFQNKGMARWKVRQPSVPMNSVGPTVEMVELFYTKNGLPINQDKDFDYENRYSTVDMPVNYDGNNYSTKSNGKTMKQHLDREPRFYAWVGFHNGWYETSKHNNAKVSNDDAKKAIVLDMTKNGEQGRGNRTNHYSYTGYLCKKFVHPKNEGKPVNYPFPVFRMAELHLNYAEALIEWGHALGDDKSKFDEAIIHIDLIRKRAGIPGVVEAWRDHSINPDYPKTYEGLRDIVRRERTIELYMEGQHFWDVRRWIDPVQAEMTPDSRFHILNTLGETEEELFNVQEDAMPKDFNKAQYLMPIDKSEINKVPQLIQNPFYE